MTTLAKVDNITGQILSEFTGGSTADVAMMIGIGLVKDSDAVFFQYLGEEQPARALSYPSGKPVTKMANVRLNGIEVVDGIGEFASTKLNVFIESSEGTILMLTSGLQTIWSQCVITALMGLVGSGNLDAAFSLDTWKGTSKMRPCFGSIKVNNVGMKDNELYALLTEARSDGNKQLVEQICRNAVTTLSNALTGGPVEEAVVSLATNEVVADF